MISIATIFFDERPCGATLRLLAAAGVRAVEAAFIAGYTPFDDTLFDAAQGSRMRGSA